MANTYHQIHIQGIFAVKNPGGLFKGNGKMNYTNTLQALFKRIVTNY
jgi:hypothetical protein